jgi:hypothetical protein
MKPRSLFDNPEAWVSLEFKPLPKPQTPVVFLQAAKPREETPDLAPVPESIAEPETPVRQIIKTVSQVSGISIRDLKGPSRLSEYVGPRQVICYLAHTFTDRSLPAIGRQLGGRDHTTILNGKRKTERLIRDRQIQTPEEGTIEAWAEVLINEVQLMQADSRARYRYRHASDLKAWRERRKEARRIARLARSGQ